MADNGENSLSPRLQHASSLDTSIGSTEGEEYFISINSSEDDDDYPNETTPLNSKKLTKQNTTIENKRNTSAADLRLSMLSNFSTSYNVVNVSIALKIMGSIYEGTDHLKSLCTSTLIAGMIVGQLTGGALGDWMGRHAAMACVMCLQVVSAFMSALSYGWNNEGVESWDVSSSIGLNVLRVMGIKSLSIYHVLAGWRFLLGVGCGGVYPLAATLTAESSTEKSNRGRLVALTFSMQGVGYLASPLVAWALVTILGETSDVAWRILLGLGCVPGLFLIAVRVGRRKIRSRDQTNEKSTKENAAKDAEVTKARNLSSGARLPAVSILDAIRTEEQLGRKLLGAGGSWLLFDVLFYGNTLFQPVVLSAAFGSAETVSVTIRDTVFIAAVALPGYFISVFAIGKQSPKYIQMQGFLVMSIIYCVIGLKFDSLSESKALLLGLYASTFFFSNYGPNSTVRDKSEIMHISNFILTNQLCTLMSTSFLCYYILGANSLFCFLLRFYHAISDIHVAIDDLLTCLPFNPEWNLCCMWENRCASGYNTLCSCFRKIW
uniref:Major facilitator superfamily (MFS) profile domain-containing protein n=1 Tax=Ditylum brightwellii TaxID=49249 RepID=A0A7S4TB30_9STRA